MHRHGDVCGPPRLASAGSARGVMLARRAMTIGMAIALTVAALYVMNVTIALATSDGLSSSAR